LPAPARMGNYRIPFTVPAGIARPGDIHVPCNPQRARPFGEQSGSYLGQGEWSKTTDAGALQPVNPATGEVLGTVHASSAADYEIIVKRAQAAFKVWRTTPAPQLGEAVRLCGEALRKYKDALGSLVALEMGKIKPEGDGEVQEMIDIAD